MYVPTLNIRRLSLQLLTQQSDDIWAGGHVLGDGLHLRWDNHTKIVPYHSASNLPVLFAVPGGIKARSYIARHAHY